MNANPEMPTRRRSDGWARGLFWGWNVVFLAVVLFGFAPLQLPMLIESVREGTTPVLYVYYSLVIIGIPVISTLIGIFLLRKEPARLFALGYVVEWPLLLIMLFRFFVIREGNPAITVLLVWLALAEAVFIWHLVDKRIDERAPFWRHLRLAGLTLLFAGTIYAAVWLLFYVPLVGALLYQGIATFVSNFGEMVRNSHWTHWYELPLAILGNLLAYFSGALILIMPVSAPIVAGRAWWSSLRKAQASHGRALPALTALVPLALVLGVLALSMRQPQHRAFALLADLPDSTQEAQALLEQEQEIRAGLLNAYLASFRYLSSEGEVRFIADAYRWMLNASQPFAWRIERAHETILMPFLYTPVTKVLEGSTDNQALLREQQEAAELYQRFFDEPIAQGERQKIVAAVRSTSNVNQAELAWQAVDDREVHLNHQEVTVSEHGDWAEVLLYEVYENRTFQRQEVVYYFSLPESAVITGLWLGGSPDRSQAFEYQVVPRGAAQALYRNEVRYMRDPALVEQIGPRQYRLRAFPVWPQQWAGGPTEREAGPLLHLWLRYRTLAVEGAWPLPQLAERFNVYWDNRSTRLIAGETLRGGEEAWLPASVAPTQAVVQATHRVDFPGGVSVQASPVGEVQRAQLPADLQLAVVLDRSFSMRERTGEVKQALDELRQAASSAADPEIFLTSSQFRGESPGKTSLASLDPDSLFYFGGQNAAELLAQFDELSEGKRYDLILVLTDGTGYEVGQGQIQLTVPEAPVWLVHLGGGFPLGYDDPTLQVIQASGGGAAASVDEALARYAIGRASPGQVDVVDGYRWEFVEHGDLSAYAAEPDFAPFAVRRLILAEMARNKGDLSQLAVLDQLHALAVEQSVVTPYSSMLVLVNAQQQIMLDKLEGRGDRFEREVENVGATAGANPFAVTGVPEPEEWLLLSLAALTLAFVAWRRLAQRGAA